MIRVLHVIGSLAAGGIESFLLNTYRRIDREHIQFDFVIGSSDGWVQSYEDEINRLGGKMFLIPTYNFKQFSLFLDAHPEYDIVHCHRGAMSVPFLHIAKKHGISTRIVHSHSTSDSFFKRMIFYVLKKNLSNVATDFIACGDKAGLYLFGNRQFHIIYNGIDTSRFIYNPTKDEAVRNELGIMHNSLVFGHIGRFEYPKNHEFLIDIFAEIAKIEKKAKFLLIGDGSMKIGIEQKSKEKGIYERCIFTGNRSDVHRLLQCIDCVVFPSHFEGFSVAMIEMQAASVPILASSKVPQEINVTGLVTFFDLSNNPIEWAQKAVILGRGNKKSNRSTQIVESGLDSNNTVHQLERIYKPF